MVLVCNGFIDGSPETQKALLDKMEGYLNHTQSEEFRKEYEGLARDFAGSRLMKNLTSWWWSCSASASPGRMIMA